MRWTRGIGSLSLAAAAACSTTGPSDPDSLLNQDVAVVAAEVAAQDVEVMRGPAGPLGFGLRADFGRFECDAAERGGLTVTRTCVFKDAAGNVQPAYDPITTASVTVHSEIEGSLDRGPWSATFDRTSDLTVTGLAGAETSMTWNGSQSTTSSRVRQTEDGGTREYNMTHSATVTDVVIPVPRSWPLSGTITRHLSIEFIGGPRDGTTVERTVTITFNGSQNVSVTVDGETFDVDLSARQRPQRRRP
jgi:hypothetical protein